MIFDILVGEERCEICDGLNLNLRAIQITNALILTPVFADLNVYFDWYLFFK